MSSRSMGVTNVWQSSKAMLVPIFLSLRRLAVISSKVFSKAGLPISVGRRESSRALLSDSAALASSRTKNLSSLHHDAGEEIVHGFVTKMHVLCYEIEVRVGTTRSAPNPPAGAAKSRLCKCFKKSRMRDVTFL